MDPALIKEKEAFFKKRANVEPAKKKSSAKVRLPSRPIESKKPKKKRVDNGEVITRIRSAAQTAHKSNNPHRLLKSVMDMMKERYINRDYEILSLDEILEAVDLADIKLDSREWIRGALIENPKIAFYQEEAKFLFKPSLGHQVNNRKQLLAKLRDNELLGTGGILMSDIREAVHNPEKAMKRLIEEDLVVCITRQDKEEIVFYNNPEFAIVLKSEGLEQFQAMWHRESVEGMTGADVEKYLQNVGLGAMQGEERKRRAPGTQRKARKKAKQNKVMNTHLDEALLKEYS